jgi:hypothetical protein
LRAVVKIPSPQFVAFKLQDPNKSMGDNPFYKWEALGDIVRKVRNTTTM